MASLKGWAVIILGPPGAGKGTQAELLAQHLGGRHLSSGEILRRSPDPEIQARLAKGDLIDSATVIRVMEQAITAVPLDQPVILDGTSRELDEAKHWLTWLPEQGRELRRVILIDVPKSESIKRDLERGRPDDRRSAQEHRWELYNRETLPAIEFYRQQGLLTTVDGVGSVQTVDQRLQAAL